MLLLFSAASLAAAAAIMGGSSPQVTTPPPHPAAADLVRLFAYDATASLDVESKAVNELADATVHDLSYASPKGGRVSALLVVPRDKGPHAGILFGHWGGGNRTEFLPEAILYARAGAVSLLPDYPWTRPTPWRQGLRFSSDPEHDLPIYVQAVVDLRRGLDVLLARSDVDPRRLAYVGHSWGAQWGAILAAVDRRPRATVLIGGIPDLAALYRESDDPDYEELRRAHPERIDRLLEVMASLAPVRYVPYASPIPQYFQFARHEQNFKEAAMLRYFAAASDPKRIDWYLAGHDLNDPQALADRAAWLRRHDLIGKVRLPQPH